MIGFTPPIVNNLISFLNYKNSTIDLDQNQIVLMKWHKKNHSYDLVCDRDNHIQMLKHILKQNGLNLNLNLNFLRSILQLMV